MTENRPASLARYAAVTGLIAAGGLGIILGASLLLGWFSVHLPDWALSLDVASYRAAAKLTSPPITRVLFTLFNDPGLDYTIAIVACLGYAWWKRRKDFPWAVVAVILTLVVGSSTMPYMQWYGFRPRPFTIVTDVVVDPYWRQVWQGIPTFPSGHVRELTGLCFVLGYFWPGSRWLATAYAALVAFTRVYLGAHFPSDVLAGVLVGLCAGGYSVLLVNPVSTVFADLSARLRARTAFAHLFSRDQGGPAAKAVRVLFPLALLVGVAAAAGNVLHSGTPRILADYLLNTDNSLIAPLLDRFDLAIAQVTYPLVADGRFVFSVLIGLGLVSCAARRKGGAFAQLLLASLLCFAVTLLLDSLVASHFLRPRPAETASLVPQEWRALWQGPVGFPVSYLLALISICTVVAASLPAIAKFLYAYAIAAGIGLLYFGAAWPTDAILTLPLGHLFGRWAVSASVEALRKGRVGNDHLEGASDYTAGDRSGS